LLYIILVYIKKNLDFITKNSLESSKLRLETNSNEVSLVSCSFSFACSQFSVKKGRRYFKKQPHIVFQKRKTSKSFKKRFAIEWQITMNSIVIIIAFCLAWLPYGLISMFAQFSENREQFVTPHTTILPVLFAKTSVVLNPVIYFLRNQKFRTHIKSIFRRE
jgi:hypothetical protein